MSKEFLRHYKYKFDLDGELVTVHIKRMTFEESQEFSDRSGELEKTVLEERIFRGGGTEQEKDEKGNFKISFGELCQQRLGEMSSAERADIENVQTDRIKQQTEFMVDCIKRFVMHVEPGLIDVYPDGSKHPVTNGEELIEIIGARRDLHLELYQAIFAENHLSAHQKKAWKSLAGSSPSSKPPKKARAGRKQKTTAGSAEISDSAGNGGARRRRNGPSGSEARENDHSSSIAAQS
jgi:hypothetical protein